jgi:HD-GYP domain-containing protein (c-di-GMP phosphodiesterase class II)
MNFEPLSLHRARFEIGKPTPFAIFDESGRLLLARGHRFESLAQLEKLVERDAVVDPRDPQDPARRIAHARAEQLPAFWADSMGEVGRLLRANPTGDFTHALDEAARPLLALIERDPDQAILQAVRGEAFDGNATYATRHAVHTATAACLAATRLGWSMAHKQCVLRTALTMNLAMVDLQNRLATQVSPVTPLQRAEIQGHPERSAAMLELAGVTDPDWLEAVRQHHEEPGGKGYPRGLAQVHAVAQLVHSADVFTAKLSPRGKRQPMLADAAARAQYQAVQGDMMTAALIKEFGLYPPGCTVRLKSGEAGLVMRRGETASTPLVAVLTERDGGPRPEPMRRDTALAAYAIVAVMPPSGLKVRMPLETLLQAVHG